MWCGTYRRGTPDRRSVHGLLRPAFITAIRALACAPLVAGCSTAHPPVLAAASPGAPTVTFESIDGPPETVFRKLVAQLTEEAGARRIAVVSRELAAQYRIRGYVAAHVRGRRTTIAWVWDIYNADQQRAMRLAGEVPSTSALRDWSAADDQIIGRIARDGMERLAVFLAAPPAFPGAVPGEPLPRQEPGPNVALAPAPAAAAADILSFLTPLAP